MAGQPYDSQIPPINQADYASIPPPQTTWPKNLGIIMIIFGGFGMLSGAIGLFAWRLMEFAMKQAGHPEVMNLPIIQRWMLLTTVFAAVGLGLAVVLLISGIGLINRRRWAVGASKSWAGLKIILALATVMANWIMQTKLIEAVSAGAIDAESVQPLVKDGTSIVAMLPGLGMTIALAVFVLIWLSVRSQKEETSQWV